MPWLRSLQFPLTSCPALLTVLVCLSPAAADWPQWLGPNRDASTSEQIVPWKGKLELLWKQPVDEGHSSPIVAGGCVYLHTRDGKAEAEALRAFDAKTGKPLWRTSYKRAAYKGLFGNGPRATPTVAGGSVFTFGITGVLTSFDADSGKRIWQVDTIKKFRAPKLFFGSSCSPLVEGDKVLMNVGGKGASIVAFNRQNGEVIWKTLDHKASYSSPIAFGKGIERQAVFLTGTGLASVAVKDGSVFWQLPFKDKLAESSTTPVKMGNILIGSSITRGTVGLKLINTTAIPTAKQIWMNNKLTCYFATPVPVGKHLYLVTGSIGVFPSATLHCMDPKTGKKLWSKNNVGKYHASLLRTKNNKLLLLEESGEAVLLDPNPKGYRELARAKICGNTWAHPAISDGRLYIRDGKNLICVALPR